MVSTPEHLREWWPDEAEAGSDGTVRITYLQLSRDTFIELLPVAAECFAVWSATNSHDGTPAAPVPAS